jgi:hypothetical protein
VRNHAHAARSRPVVRRWYESTAHRRFLVGIAGNHRDRGEHRRRDHPGEIALTKRAS